jgi:hypothetical protein
MYCTLVIPNFDFLPRLNPNHAQDHQEQEDEDKRPRDDATRLMRTLTSLATLTLPITLGTVRMLILLR